MTFKNLLLLLLFPCAVLTAQNTKAKFEPADGKCLFFIGQDLGAVGGVEGFNQGYCDQFEIPSGVTTYTNFSPGELSFALRQNGNDGLAKPANWGAGYNCAQCYIDDPDFKYTVIAIGLSMVGHEKKVANGQHDYLIRELGEWIKKANRPVFLRIGYEFDGWEWNHYKKKYYLKAWKRIHGLFKQMQVNNVAFVWQSKGNGSGQKVLEAWYPGDEVVDWCAYSYFNNPDTEMLTFARKHHKPVFIAEATPVLHDGAAFTDSDLSKPHIAPKAWDEWFVPFFKMLNDNGDVIKAFSYINANWAIQPMWINNPVFQKVDSRIQQSEFISKKWQEEIAKPRYLKPTTELWPILENNQ